MCDKNQNETKIVNIFIAQFDNNMVMIVFNDNYKKLYDLRKIALEEKKIKHLSKILITECDVNKENLQIEGLELLHMRTASTFTYIFTELKNNTVKKIIKEIRTADALNDIIIPFELNVKMHLNKHMKEHFHCTEIMDYSVIDIINDYYLPNPIYYRTLMKVMYSCNYIKDDELAKLVNILMYKKIIIATKNILYNSGDISAFINNTIMIYIGIVNSDMCFYENYFSRLSDDYSEQDMIKVMKYYNDKNDIEIINEIEKIEKIIVNNISVVSNKNICHYSLFNPNTDKWKKISRSSCDFKW